MQESHGIQRPAELKWSRGLGPIRLRLVLLLLIGALTPGCNSTPEQQATHSADTETDARARKTTVSIVGEEFHINGAPTYPGRKWRTSDGQEHRIEGLLMNSRMVQGIFDDINPATRGQWSYPDTGHWDPDRNTTEFLQAMEVWREHGLLAFTLNLQGGCPYGYCRQQPWENSAFAPDGSLRDGFMGRLERILDRADELGMAVILGYFYFGQDERMRDEAAVKHAVENATRWVLEKGYRNVLVEINNECNVRYDHAVLGCERAHELIELAKGIRHEGRSLYVSTSLGGGRVPPANLVTASDFVLLHGNGVRDPARMEEMIRQVRELEAYRPMPILINEDDQPWRVTEQGWGEQGNNFAAAVRNYASWGFFDFRQEAENLEINQGYQSVPVNWQISAERKKSFFDLLAQITGSPGAPTVHPEFSTETGRLTVRVENKPAGAQIRRVELLINNQVVSGLEQSPFEFRITELPGGSHWVRARLIYDNGGRQLSVDSPLYRDPWWPYGGPPRPENER